MLRLTLFLALLVTSPLALAEPMFVPTFRNLTLDNGLVLDRVSDRTTVSCAATGLVSYAKVVAANRGEMPTDEVYPQVRQAFTTTIETNPARNRGWLFHFTDPQGQPKSYTEVSTIDTAIFYAAFLRAATLMNDPEFLTRVRENLNKIDVNYVMDGDYFRHGFHWVDGNPELIPWKWQDSDEGAILYTLFDKTAQLRKRVDLPLFTYFYPLCFGIQDDQVALLNEAIAYQSKTHRFIGVSASDGPHGYQAGDPNVFSPLAVYAASPFSDLAHAELDRLPYPKTTPAFADGWVAKDRIGIDDAATYILVNPVPNGGPIDDSDRIANRDVNTK